MTVRACIAGLLLSLALVGTGRAADPPAVRKIDSIDGAAMAAYKAGDAQRAKNQLLEAIILGKETGFEAHAIMARVYLHLGVVHAEGMKDEEKARRYYSLALRIQPDIAATGSLATPTVVRGLERARDALEAAAPPPALEKRVVGPAPAPAETAKARAKRLANEAADAREREQAAASARTEAGNHERLAAETRARDEATAAAMLREKEREARDKEQRLREEQERLGKDLAAVQDRERRERDDKERLQKEKQELERQLAESKDREKSEKENKDRLQKTKEDLEKQLAESRDKEKKEKEAKAKLEAQERERIDRENKIKAARDKLAEGPSMPASIPQPVYCPTEDEWATGEDVFIHCAPQSNVKAKEMALYYRPSGTLHFSSLLMQRNAKGWYMATIPASRVTGRMLQYYVEARGAKGEAIAANGKANSPNIMMIRPRATTHAEAAAAEAPVAEAPAGKLSSASSTREKSRSGSRTRGKVR